MGFCIDPQDRERNYHENREAEKEWSGGGGGYSWTYNSVVGKKGVGQEAYIVYMCRGETEKRFWRSVSYGIRQAIPYDCYRPLSGI